MTMDPSLTRVHWDQVYETVETEQLGWYEADPEPSVRLIRKTGIDTSDTILDVGSGSSTLIDALLRSGYRDIIAADISRSAIEQARAHLTPGYEDNVRWVVDDVARPSLLRDISGVAVWHDRALLHFLLDEADRTTYRDLIDSVLKPRGWVIIAAFTTNGAARCSGLRVRRYDAKMLSAFMGSGFELVEQFDHTYVMPSGDKRPYIYTLFRGRR